jgi:hypothetical protein
MSWSKRGRRGLKQVSLIQNVLGKDVISTKQRMWKLKEQKVVKIPNRIVDF